MLTESHREFSDLHTIFRLRALRYLVVDSTVKIIYFHDISAKLFSVLKIENKSGALPGFTQFGVSN